MRAIMNFTSFLSSLQEVGIFPLAALLEVGNANLNRVELVWSPITSHLGEVSEKGWERGEGARERERVREEEKGRKDGREREGEEREKEGGRGR